MLFWRILDNLKAKLRELAIGRCLYGEVVFMDKNGNETGHKYKSWEVK